MTKGMFIVFEGIDGAGTTTQSKLLAQWFSDHNHPVHLTWEPSTGKIGRLIRDILSGAEPPPDPEAGHHALALLFAADRLDHLAREIAPRLADGINVISDRYLLSSLVYQSLHCDADWVRAINTQAPSPDLTFLLDLPVPLAMDRIAKRNLITPSEIFETADQQTKIRDRYLAASSQLYPEQPIILIDAAATPDVVHRQIVTTLDPILNAWPKI